MSDYNEITAIITTEEPAVAATLDDLRYLVFEGKKGDTGDSAYEEAVALGFVGTEEEWIASLKGDPGPRGFSPLVEVEETAAGHHVTFTDVSGETSFNIPNGPAGPDGVSPVVSVENITGGHRVTIEDAEHVNSFDVMDGEKGDRGIPGSPGISPRITVTDITGGHRVTIQDGWGESTFDVMDGQSGTSANAVLYTEQTLNDSQKAQARENIGAKPPIYLKWDDTVDPGICEKSATEIALLFADGYDVHLPMQAFRGYDLRLRSAFVVDNALVVEFGDVFIKEGGGLENITATVDEQKHIDVGRTHISSAELETSQEIDDWADGRALDAGTAKDVLNQILDEVGDELNSKANASDIPTKTSELDNDSGYQTAQQVQTAIEEAAELPTGGSTGDFLRKTASGVAWETVPTYTGGNY